MFMSPNNPRPFPIVGVASVIAALFILVALALHFVGLSYELGGYFFGALFASPVFMIAFIVFGFGAIHQKSQLHRRIAFACWLLFSAMFGVCAITFTDYMITSLIDPYDMPDPPPSTWAFIRVYAIGLFMLLLPFVPAWYYWFFRLKPRI